MTLDPGRVFTGIAALFDRGFDPARARKLPVRNEAGESNVRGLYLVGEIPGTPQIKLSLNVMSFAKNRQSFYNENTSCIHCGICITV